MRHLTAPKSPARRPSAFTLIELLVVVAAISILAARNRLQGNFLDRNFGYTDGHVEFFTTQS